MFTPEIKVGPAWLSLDVVKQRMRPYLRLLQWSNDHTEIDLHFMVGPGELLWNTLGPTPDLGEAQGVLAYAVITLPKEADDARLDLLAQIILHTLAANYLTTLTQLGEKWNAQEKYGPQSHPAPNKFEEDPDD